MIKPSNREVREREREREEEEEEEEESGIREGVNEES